ncbi:MAG: hypothetical protein IPF92_19315 [Myxococcales bacterium]|nr:hypothetical protein [Myxococcales bacterium]
MKPTSIQTDVTHPEAIQPVKRNRPKAERVIRYWPTSMREEIDRPIPFAVCPPSSTYPSARAACARRTVTK